MDFTFYFWDNLIALIAIIVGVFVGYHLYALTQQISAREKYEHEMKITKQIREIVLYKKIILADVKKYNAERKDETNNTYYKQGAELYTIIQEYGVQFILDKKGGNIPVGIVPFEWIEYIRDCDSEDSKPIIVCKFKGKRYYQKFKSPFKEIVPYYENTNYKNGDPEFRKYTSIKPK